MFLPETREEMKARTWDELDIILVTGDAYIDSAFSGTAVIGRVLEAAGYRVGIIAQPDISNHEDITRLGAPKLFWGVNGGCVDSLVANTTATLKRRRQDDFTPGGENNRRPDRAVIAYSNLIRTAFKPCAPIVIGGIEASLRRIAHYDYWTDKIRRPILFDAKADILSYGMGERCMVELADAIKNGREWRGIRGICHASPTLPEGVLELPAYAEASPATPEGKQRFFEMFRLFSDNQDPVTAKTLAQKVDTRWLIHNPPQPVLTPAELDRVHELPYENAAHPRDLKGGAVRALDTVRFSVTLHRGCYGACRFCAITAHQGRRVVSRSEESVVREVTAFTKNPRFRGIVSDAGGPTANMYGFECPRKTEKGACANRQCLYPEPCPSLPVDHRPLTRLLKRLRAVPGIRAVFSASGIRPDLVEADRAHGEAYLEELASHHVSGQLKLAPEHSEKAVLDIMGKPSIAPTEAFIRRFNALNRARGLRQFVTCYFIAAHPGSTEAHMRALKTAARRDLGLCPEQVQIFTPTPSTWATAFYWTGLGPDGKTPLFSERGLKGKAAQKAILCPTPPRG